MSNAPLRHAVSVKSDGSGGVTPCDPGDGGDPSCVTFQIGDVDALMAEVYVDAPSRFIGNRCDKKPSDIARDANGRIVRNGGGCQGLNPGALLVVLATQMKRNHLALAIDAQNDFNTDQIWNQPAYRYEVYRFQPLSRSDAAGKVMGASLDGGAPPNAYPWDAAAQGFALVDIGIQWVHENGPNTTPISGLDNTNETRFVAVLELDKIRATPPRISSAASTSTTTRSAPTGSPSRPSSGSPPASAPTRRAARARATTRSCNRSSSSS